MSPVFLLSPAFCGGRRAAVLLKPASTLPLAERLRAGTLTLGEAFSFLSGLYFRGKLTYALAFDPTFVRTHVITPTRGLLSPAAPISAELLHEFASVDVSADDARYREPLVRDVTALAKRLNRGGEAPRIKVVLLGSIATGKYVDVLAGLLGPALCYPTDFIGRGDMSRGGLLLRSAQAGTELDYAVLDPTVKRRGPRPPKLAPVQEPTNISPWLQSTSPPKQKSPPRLPTSRPSCSTRSASRNG